MTCCTHAADLKCMTFYDNGERHDNCLDNINRSLGTMRPIIQPVNLFMNTAIERWYGDCESAGIAAWGQHCA